MHDPRDFDLTDPLGPMAEYLDLDDEDAVAALAEVWSLGEPPDDEELAAVRAGLVERGRSPERAAELVARARREADAQRLPPLEHARRMAVVRATLAQGLPAEKTARVLARLLAPDAEA